AVTRIILICSIAALIVVSLIFAAACRKNRLPENPVNTQLTRTEDVTGDGKPETITLFIKAASYKAPVQWLLTIDSEGKTIFETDGDDTEVDSLFDDREAMPGCPDYPTCKNEYYFHSMLENLVTRTYDPEDVLDMTNGGTLNPGVRAYLARCCSLGPAAVDRA